MQDTLHIRKVRCRQQVEMFVRLDGRVCSTCCTLSSTTFSLAMSLESTSKQNNMSEEETVSKEWEGRKVRWKRFFPT